MGKLRQIEISNFKSIKNLKIDGCEKINVFVGYPNAGKSNILEALGLFGMLVNYKINAEDFVRFNNSDELFFEGNTSDKIEMRFDGTFLNIETAGIAWEEEEDFLYFGAKDELRSNFYFSNEFSSLNNFDNIKKYHFKQNESSGSSNDKSLSFPFGENIGKIITTYPQLRKEVKEFFEQNGLKLLIEKNTNTLKIFKEFEDGTVFTLPYNMIADTLQRLIFYKAAILSNQNAVLLFEEPEAHCFEPYILEFTNGVKYDKNDNQFFIVTHSDFIIQEFLRDEDSKNNTNIYLVNNVNGQTKVKLLDRNKNEDVYDLGMNVFFNFESLWETN